MMVHSAAFRRASIRPVSASVLLASLVLGGAMAAGAQSTERPPLLFGIADARGVSTLLRVDPLVGSSEEIGPVGFDRCGGLAAHEDVVYGLCLRPGTLEMVLVDIEPRTGAGREIGPTGIDAVEIGDLAATADGILFASTRPQGLWSISRVTGVATPLPALAGCCDDGLTIDGSGRLLAAGPLRFGPVAVPGGAEVADGPTRPAGRRLRALTHVRLLGGELIYGASEAEIVVLEADGQLGVTVPAPPGLAALAVPPGSDLGIAMDADLAVVAPGGAVSYRLTIANRGPLPSSGATVEAVLPAQLGDIRWTCSAALGSRCASGQGTGLFAERTALPVGGEVTFVVDATVATDAAGALAAQFIVRPARGRYDPDPADNSVVDRVAITLPGSTQQGVGPAASVGLHGTLEASVDLLAGELVLTTRLWNEGPLAQGDNPGDEFFLELAEGLTLTQGNLAWNGSLGVGEQVELVVRARPADGLPSPGTVYVARGLLRADLDGDGGNETPSSTDDPRTPEPEDSTAWSMPSWPELVIVPLGAIVLPLGALMFLGAWWRQREIARMRRRSK